MRPHGTLIDGWPVTSMGYMISVYQRAKAAMKRLNEIFAAPPQAVANRAVIAKAAPPPQSASFAAKQQVLAQHPGESVPRQQMQQLRPANATVATLVKRAPPGTAARRAE